MTEALVLTALAIAAFVSGIFVAKRKPKTRTQIKIDPTVIKGVESAERRRKLRKVLRAELDRREEANAAEDKARPVTTEDLEQSRRRLEASRERMDAWDREE